MPSLRRNLSPVPRPGSRSSGEVGSVASPLSRSSSAAQTHSPVAGGFQYSAASSLELGLYKIHSFISASLYRRSSRSVDRPKWKGLSWGRAFLHFSVCFMVGAFMGLAPYASTGMSVNMSKHRTLFFELMPSVGNRQYARSENSNSVLEINQKTSTPLAVIDLAGNASSLQNITQSEVLADASVEESFPKLLVEEQRMETKKLLIVVTSTYTWPLQAYGLNRLAQTLKLVRPPLLWIVVEMDSQSAETSDILRKSGVMYRHLVYKSNATVMGDKNVEQRNVALEHMEIHHLDGIVYFADGTNIYSTELFERLRQVRRFGVWKVARPLINQRMVILRGPVCNGSEVIGWNTNRNRLNRRFYADMSGFAFNSTILWDPKRWHHSRVEPIRQPYKINEEFQVSAFIEQLVEEESQMEGLPGNCSNILIWNLPLEAYVSTYPQEWSVGGNLDSNTPLE